MASANPVTSTPNPSVSLSHIECLKRLCIFCHEKFNLRDVPPTFFSKIRDIIQGDVLAVQNPRSICNSCRSDLYKEDRADDLKYRRIRTQPSVDELLSINLNGPCNCKNVPLAKGMFFTIYPKSHTCANLSVLNDFLIFEILRI